MRLMLHKLNTLQAALGISVAVHAALLTVRFTQPEAFDRIFRDTALEVILVNAKTDERVEKATAIAQSALAGGGDLERGRATSPLPPSAFTAVGNSAEDTRRQIEAMQEQQMLLLANLKQQLAAMAQTPPHKTGAPAEQAEQEEKRRQLLELFAEIERRINEENRRPRKHYVSPATKEAAYAVYVDALRRRIETRGTENFPEISGRKLYGELSMLLTIDHQGRVVSTEILASSGNPLLDRRAQAIVNSIGNFGAFTNAMRRQADQIVLPSRFNFTHEETLQTVISAE